MITSPIIANNATLCPASHSWPPCPTVDRMDNLEHAPTVAGARVVARDTLEPASPSEPPSPERAQHVAAFGALRREHVGDPRGAFPALDPHAGPEERLLHRLVVGELPVVAALERAQMQLAQALLGALDRPAHARALAGVLKTTVQISNAVTRRLQDALAATATLRAQRRLLGHQERQDGDRG
jgi:hypothetical protein